MSTNIRKLKSKFDINKILALYVSVAICLIDPILFIENLFPIKNRPEFWLKLIGIFLSPIMILIMPYEYSFILKNFDIYNMDDRKKGEYFIFFILPSTLIWGFFIYDIIVKVIR